MREDYQRIHARVSLDAILENMESMKANIAPGTGIMAVIKTDGYGHGAVPIARALEPLDYCQGFAVATAEEAFILRRAGIRKPVLVLGFTFPYSYRRMIREEIRMTVFLPETLSELSGTVRELGAQGTGKKARIHIKVDTGMNRIGIRPDAEGLSFVKEALDTDGIQVEGIFTHFARADETDKTAARHQLDSFRNFTDLIEKETGYKIPIRHCSNSAGIVELPEANMDMVRAGITLYGLWPSGEVKRDIIALHPALSLHSHIVYIKEIGAGDEVSYGGIFRASSKMRVATIPAGYGDGYPRGLSGRGAVLIRGKRAAILGRICMDQFMVDVTQIPEAAMGDEVTLIGRDGEEEITMEQLGELSGRFNYELACNLGKRVPRVYIKGGRVLCTRDWYEDF